MAKREDVEMLLTVGGKHVHNVILHCTVAETFEVEETFKRMADRMFKKMVDKHSMGTTGQ